MRVPGEGPVPSRVCLIGEGPGREEDRAGRPFVGKSGEILWQFVFRYLNLRRDEVYVTNLSKERLSDDKDQDRPPTEAEFAAMAPELLEEIARVAPAYCITLGRYSTRALLGRDLPMETVHGRSWLTPWNTLGARGAIVIPAVHPAAGIRKSEYLAYTAADLQAAGEVIRFGATSAEAQAFTVPQDQYPSPQYRVIRGGDDWWGISTCISHVVAIDTEGPRRRPWCLTFSVQEGEAWLIRADDQVALAAFRDWLARNQPIIVLHYGLHDLPPLRVMGIDFDQLGLRDKIRDTGENLYLMPTESGSLKVAAHRWLGMEMRSYEEVVGPHADRLIREHIEFAVGLDLPEWQVKEGRKWTVQRRIANLLKPSKAAEPKTLRDKWWDKDFYPIRAQVEEFVGPAPRVQFDDIPEQEMREYACADADGTLRLWNRTAPIIVDQGLTRIAKIDMRAQPLFDRMQEVGMYVDMERLADLKRWLIEASADALQTCRDLTDRADFNPQSGDQVAAFCAEQYRLHGILGLSKLTKSRMRESTADELLKAIRLDHPVIDWILLYRHYEKLLTTDIAGIEEFRDPETGRVYPVWKLLSVSSGRAAAENPNVLAAPVRSEVGRRFRACYRAAPGRRIGTCDLSQIELRVAAALGQDAAMLQAFREGKDFHAETGERLLGIPAAEQDPYEHRIPIKTGNFAMLYGATAFKLEEEFKANGIRGWDQPRCQGFIDGWYGIYPGVLDYFDRTIDQVRRDGYVETPGGRRRPLPAIRLTGNRWPMRMLREEAERQARNVPIQGGATEIIKQAMPVIEREVMPQVHEMGWYLEPMLQIHDEILVEYDEDAEDVVRELMVEAMERLSPWRGVPIRASWASAESWGEIKK